MQKQKINDNCIYLAMQNTYEDIQIALFNNDQLLSYKTIQKIFSSRDLIPTLDLILKENNYTLENLNFIGLNQGPGPYTTLRVVITTANALNFGGDLPLIGIDGLDAISKEYFDNDFQVNVAILNAYNNDVYFVIDSNNEIKKGWQNINDFLNELNVNFKDQKIKFIGNGVNLFKEEIKNIFFDNAVFQESNPQTCSIEQIAKMAYAKWLDKQDIFEQIQPLYLKEAIKYQSK